MAIIAQGELVGNQFARNFHLHFGTEVIPVGQQRWVRVVAALNEESGEMEFRPAKLVPIAVSLLPKIPLVQGTIFDSAFQKPSLRTARKKGASSAGVDTKALSLRRGGNPDYHIPKTGGFALKSTSKEIAKETKRKKREAENATFYKSHP
jgi:hypothetical protein